MVCFKTNSKLSSKICMKFCNEREPLYLEMDVSGVGLAAEEA